MFTELCPNCLSVSVGQVSSDNGLPYVSMNVIIKDTEHKSLFGFKKLSFLRFTTWSVGGVQDLIALMGLVKPSKYLSSLREGSAAISLLIPFLKPITSIAACEYPVGLDEFMGPEGTGSGP